MQVNNSIPQYVGSTEACKILRVTGQTIRKWGKTGKIDFIMSPGGRYLFDVAGYVSKQRKIEEPKPPPKKASKPTAPTKLPEISDRPAHVPPPRPAPVAPAPKMAQLDLEAMIAALSKPDGAPRVSVPPMASLGRSVPAPSRQLPDGVSIRDAD